MKSIFFLQNIAGVTSHILPEKIGSAAPERGRVNWGSSKKATTRSLHILDDAGWNNGPQLKN